MKRETYSYTVNIKVVCCTDGKAKNPGLLRHAIANRLANLIACTGDAKDNALYYRVETIEIKGGKDET